MTPSQTPAPVPVFDGHNDTLLNLQEIDRGHGRSFFVESRVGHVDLPRARRGGLAGGLFACFVPDPDPTPTDRPMPDDPEVPARYDLPLPEPLDSDFALRYALGLAARLFHLEAESDGRLRVVHTVAEIRRAMADGALAAVLHFEGADPIDPGMEALHVLHRAGLRSLGIVWSRPNAFGHGVPFRFPGTPDVGPGLTEAGRRLVRICNDLGVLVDLSHLNVAGFEEVAGLSRAPLVASHSGAHALCPSPRNLTDRQLDRIRDSGGLVGVNFHVGFLRKDGRIDRDTTVEEIVRHVEYMVERMGLEHVAFGSDFDGARMPGDLRDAAGLPLLLEALRARGYDDDSLRALAHGNWLRVLEETWGG